MTDSRSVLTLKSHKYWLWFAFCIVHINKKAVSSAFLFIYVVWNMCKVNEIKINFDFYFEKKYRQACVNIV